MSVIRVELTVIVGGRKIRRCAEVPGPLDQRQPHVEIATTVKTLLKILGGSDPLCGTQSPPIAGFSPDED